MHTVCKRKYRYSQRERGREREGERELPLECNSSRTEYTIPYALYSVASEGQCTVWAGTKSHDTRIHWHNTSKIVFHRKKES